jgi:hypothetical protein
MRTMRTRVFIAASMTTIVITMLVSVMQQVKAYVSLSNGTRFDAANTTHGKYNTELEQEIAEDLNETFKALVENGVIWSEPNQAEQQETSK